MFFLTVGTSFPFNRLVVAVDEALSVMRQDIEIFAQIGKSGYKPKNFEYVDLLSKEDFDLYFKKADAIIAHAGMGSISMALDLMKPILVMPRLKRKNEIINDHQLVTAKKFEKMGHILSVYDEKKISTKIESLRLFKPEKRISMADVVANRIKTFLDNID